MKKEVLNYYIYLSWDVKQKGDEFDEFNQPNESNKSQFQPYMMVAKTMVKNEMSEDVQMLGDNMFVFSSKLDFETVKDKLKHKRFPYMLIDITFNMSNGLLSTYLQDFEIEVLNNFVDRSNKNQVDYFKMKLEECVVSEDFESACLYRDLIKNKVMVSNNQEIE
jgi:hypothetical protein